MMPLGKNRKKTKIKKHGQGGLKGKRAREKRTAKKQVLSSKNPKKQQIRERDEFINDLVNRYR